MFFVSSLIQSVKNVNPTPVYATRVADTWYYFCLPFNVAYVIVLLAAANMALWSVVGIIAAWGRL